MNALVAAPWRTIPTPLTPLIGRERELAAVAACLRVENARLITLAGPGGIGKTRLGIQVASELAPEFPAGVWFVSLASVRDPALVISAITQGLGVPETSDQPAIESLKRFLADHRALLVLDNFEHVIEAAPLVTEVLGACPRLAMLVTSRTLLRVHGEQEFPLNPLALPDPARASSRADLAAVPSVALLVQRARAVRPDFQLTDQNGGIIAEICARLDGVPLALELAAARLNALAPDALLARLANRLTILTGGQRDAPERQRTLRNAIAWSYELLTPTEQRLFRGLSVFVGGFTLEAAEAVGVGLTEPSTEVLDALTTLVDSSLAQRREQPDGSSRYGMLETIREFGLEQLNAHAETSDVRAAHAAHFLRGTRTIFDWTSDRPDVSGAEMNAWLGFVEHDIPNVLEAIAWHEALDDLDACLMLALPICLLGLASNFLSEADALLGRLLATRGSRATRPVCLALGLAAQIAAECGDFQRGTRLAGETAAIARASSVVWDTLSALHIGNIVARLVGDDARAKELSTELLERARDFGNTQSVVQACHSLAKIAYHAGELDDAEAFASEALRVVEQRGERVVRSHTIDLLAQVRLARGDVESARELFQANLAQPLERYAPIETLVGLAGVAAATQHAELAARLLAVVSSHAFGEGLAKPINDYEYQQALSATRAALAPAAFERAWASAAAWSLDVAVQEARDWTLAEAPRERPRPVASPDSLSQRELDVLRLVAQGQTSQEIADALFISPRTVTTHVTHILNKLGANSRAEAVAAAARRGLL